ncbi:hypothetical protein CYMTET_47199 [Cymbomonas tetramitiformis]|uniref:Uncharacterized protein n=1 Tax=Cymbomonas tetramitiformis TaxID=36881 RepID=A0AAE0EWW5_9CHLO|nr:hypothetical protein CYMTET_47199 [Cymbomonas tetramitiformis]
MESGDDSDEDEIPLDYDTEGYDESTTNDDASGPPTAPDQEALHPIHHHSYMARSMVNHRHIPASFRRMGSPPPPTPAAPAVVRGREEHIPDQPSAASAMVLMKTNDWMEEDHDNPPQSLSAAMSTTTANHQQVPPAELQRLTSKAFEEMSPDMNNWFTRTAVCYTLCNDDPKKSILVMSQRMGQYLTLSVMIVDTGSMLFVMNKVHQETLGLKVHSSTATVDTSMGSGGTQQHRQWGTGELMLVIAPGTSDEMVLADVTGISPSSHVSFDVLLSVDILHAMSAGVLPATPGRGAALAYHPHNQRGDFERKAYLPLKVFKDHHAAPRPAAQFGGGAEWTAHLDNMTAVRASPRHPVDARRPASRFRPALMALLAFILLASFIHPTQAHDEGSSCSEVASCSATASLLTIIGLSGAVACVMAAFFKWHGHQQASPLAWPFAHFKTSPPLTLVTLAPWHGTTQETACPFCNRGACQGITRPQACHLSGGTGLYTRWVSDGKVPSHLMPLLMLVVNTSRTASGQAPLTRVSFRQQYGNLRPSSDTPETPNPAILSLPIPTPAPHPTNTSAPQPISPLHHEPCPSDRCDLPRTHKTMAPPHTALPHHRQHLHVRQVDHPATSAQQGG